MNDEKRLELLNDFLKHLKAIIALHEKSLAEFQGKHWEQVALHHAFLDGLERGLRALYAAER